MDRAVELVNSIVNNKPLAESIVERLNEEGFLHIGKGAYDVDKIVEMFKECFGNTKTTKYDRYAAHRLAKVHGVAPVCKVIELLAKCHDYPYCPIVGSVAQLETKWVSVVAFLRRNMVQGGNVDD